jgi:hypothetical protein
MKSKNVLWGLILILIGVLFILKNIGLIDLSWHGLVRVWPAIFILWGISLLPIKEFIKIIFIVVILGISTWIVIDSDGYNDSSWFGNDDDLVTYQSDQNFDIPNKKSVHNAHLELNVAASSFKIKDTTAKLLEFEKHGGKFNYEYISTFLEDNADIIINTKNHTASLRDKGDKITMKLNPSPVWTIDLDAGAASIDYDLSQFKIKELNIDAGASSFDLKLGNLYPETDVTVDAGASSFEINIPKDAGCEMKISSVLSEKNFSGFTKVGKGHYKTPNYDTAKQKIHIDIEAAVSSYTVHRY